MRLNRLLFFCPQQAPGTRICLEKVPSKYVVFALLSTRPKCITQ